ncbi:MAG TPA: glycosyltransferase [Solirubrobacterales bacterium]|nr:glycosyltransferase [Solirubrobacterales bacterium]
MLARRLRDLPTATALGREVRVAVGPHARLLGLSGLGRDEAGPGLLIPHCAGVHTFGMRFALDLVFLDRDGRPCSARTGVQPRRFACDRRASAVLELPCSQGERVAAGRRETCLQTMEAREVHVQSRSLEQLLGVIEPQARQRFEAGLERAHELLEGRRIWNVNSTSAGGGVAEMLWSWVGLSRGVGVDMRWLTIAGSADFFALTKRLHNYLHGELGDGGELGDAERSTFERVSRENAESVVARLGPEDVAILHDPQTAGLIPHVVAAGRTVIWRCHIGADERNELTAAGWDFLAPCVTRADAAVFSRKAFVPECCEGMPTAIVPPSIDVLSPKNREVEPDRVRAVLHRVGLLAPEGADGVEPLYRRSDGSEARVERRCEVAGEGELPTADARLVVQVSRWDRLKDPAGVMHGFAEVLAAGHDAWLVLAGPSLGTVTDDPDSAAVLAEVEAEWRRLPDSVRARVLPVCLPMEDLDENGVIVNALQRQATVVVQKSLKEGFGLTVTEAMWKARPVVATATGGIGDQIEDGVTGVLLQNPLDLRAFARAVGELLSNPEHARAIGEAAHESVRANFLEDRHTLQYVELLERLLRR